MGAAVIATGADDRALGWMLPTIRDGSHDPVVPPRCGATPDPDRETTRRVSPP